MAMCWKTSLKEMILLKKRKLPKWCKKRQRPISRGINGSSETKQWMFKIQCSIVWIAYRVFGELWGLGR